MYTIYTFKTLNINRYHNLMWYSSNIIQLCQNHSPHYVCVVFTPAQRYIQTWLKVLQSTVHERGYEPVGVGTVDHAKTTQDSIGLSNDVNKTSGGHFGGSVLVIFDWR